ncbi:MAG: hypothetical protein AAB531_02110 [Patescibacteria group bacterium]
MNIASKQSRKLPSGGLAVFIILGVVFIGSLVMTGGLLPSKRKPVTTTTNDIVNIPPSARSSSKKSLQLIAIGPMSSSAPTSTPGPGSSNPTPIPTTPPVITIMPGVTVRPTSPPAPTSPPRPTPTPDLRPRCPYDTNRPVDYPNCRCNHKLIYCQNDVCRDLYPGQNNCNPDPNLPYTRACRSVGGVNFTGWLCFSKPVVYLYPTRKTLVDVSVETSGEIVVSDPLYPPGGWKNVTAYPNGNLIYQGKPYRELFYETSVSDVEKPQAGIIVNSANIARTLQELNKKLGLSEFESKELSDFWVPKLKGLNSKYIQVSLISGAGKDKVDKLIISPKPDTLIEVLYYFKPLDKFPDIQPLPIPPTPKRVGFTAVEWGGTIEQ